MYISGMYVKSIYFLEIHGVVGGAKSELCIHFLQDRKKVVKIRGGGRVVMME